MDRQVGRRAFIYMCAGAGLLSIGGVIGAAFVKSPEQLRAETAPPDRSLLTAPVEKRILASTVVTRGTVDAAARVDATPATVPGASTLVVTALAVGRGDTVRAGQVLLAVSGRPVIALQGEIPGYRDLRPGSDGQDVVQLQEALRRLGHYRGGDRQGRFGPATKAAVSGLYQRVGFAVPDTGGQEGKGDRAALLAAADAVTAARRALDAAKARLANPSVAQAPGDLSPEQQVKDAEAMLSRAVSNQDDLVATTGPMFPLSELVFVPAFPARVVGLTAKVGSAVSAPLISLAAGSLGVRLRMPPEQAGLVAVGMSAILVSETLGKQASAKVESVGPLVTPQAATEGQSATPHMPVTLTPDEELAAEWNGLDVRVTIVAAQTGAEVLVVPVSAVSAAADGRTTVTVMSGEVLDQRIEVRVGVSGDGFVEINPVGGEILPGDRVVVGTGAR